MREEPFIVKTGPVDRQDKIGLKLQNPLGQLKEIKSFNGVSFRGSGYVDFMGLQMNCVLGCGEVDIPVNNALGVEEQKDSRFPSIL